MANVCVDKRENEADTTFISPTVRLLARMLRLLDSFRGNFDVLLYKRLQTVVIKQSQLIKDLVRPAYRGSQSRSRESQSDFGEEARLKTSTISIACAALRRPTDCAAEQPTLKLSGRWSAPGATPLRSVGRPSAATNNPHLAFVHIALRQCF